MRVVARPRNGRVVVEWDRVIGATTFNLYYAEESGVTKDNYLSLAGRRQAGRTERNVVANDGI